jgi:hypothetical protein
MPVVSRPTRALTMKMPPTPSTNASANFMKMPEDGTARPNAATNVCQSRPSGVSGLVPLSFSGSA